MEKTDYNPELFTKCPKCNKEVLELIQGNSKILLDINEDKSLTPHILSCTYGIFIIDKIRDSKENKSILCCYCDYEINFKQAKWINEEIIICSNCNKSFIANTELQVLSLDTLKRLKKYEEHIGGLLKSVLVLAYTHLNREYEVKGLNYFENMTNKIYKKIIDKTAKEEVKKTQYNKFTDKISQFYIKVE